MPFSDIAKIGLGLKQNKLANKINPQWVDYTTSPFASQRLGIAQQFLNGRMAGAPQLEKNLFTAQANQQENINRNATDSSQALSLGAFAQAQTDTGLTNLQALEAQNKYGMLQNLNNAYEQMISEGDKEYENKIQKYFIDAQAKSALRNSAFNNMFGGLDSIEAQQMQVLDMLTGGGKGKQSGSGGGQWNPTYNQYLNGYK